LENEFGINTEVFEKYKFLIKGNDIYFINRIWEDENWVYLKGLGSNSGRSIKEEDCSAYERSTDSAESYFKKNL